MTRILLVEDDEEVRTLIEMMLQSAGYQVRSARTAAAARTLVRQGQYGLVVTDWRLGPASGATVADAAAATGAKIIIVTGYPQDIPQAYRAQCHVLTKPFRERSLVAAIERQIGSATD